ncbi:MAG TPA: leucine-rich repeat domain-containing protein [Candidatus Butyricicoccus stercorigallinarum]|nr:leucine-rich repeat domain-containing protein [Candidatus Butyricicoccus stercorigallinarum]
METLSFEQGKRGAVLVKSAGDSAFVTVPAAWQGMPVTEIGDYAFAQQPQLRRVTLPASVDSIGNHAFYNCAALEQLILENGLRSVGDGAFKNCRLLHAISVRGLTGLKSIVTDFTNRVTLTVAVDEGRTIRLLFPEYDYAFQEVVPPREFRSVTYGSGSFYRMCVARDGVRFDEYDQTFPRAVREDVPEVVQSIAFYRLLDGYQLRPQYRDMYLDYLSAHAAEVVSAVLASRDVPRLELLLRHELLSREQLEDAIAAASAHDFPQGVSLLMDHRIARFGSARRSFVL